MNTDKSLAKTELKQTAFNMRLKRQLQYCTRKISSVHIAIYVKHMQQTSSDLHTLQNSETLRNGLEHWGYVPFNSHLKFRLFPPSNVSPTHTFMCTNAHSESVSFQVFSHTHICMYTDTLTKCIPFEECFELVCAADLH